VSAEAEVLAKESTVGSGVRLRGLRKEFGPVVAVDDIDLDIDDGEFFAVLGPSGSGKTTVQRMIAGFEIPTAGTVELGGVDATREPPFRRDVNTVFQDYALFPHMTVAQNVEYGLRVKRVGKADRVRLAAAALEMVRLGDMGARRPSQLSGGQRQRVALARALISDARVLALDDPLSAVDTENEERIVRRLRPALAGRTVLLSSQRLSTVSLADRAVVLEDGVIVEDAAPGRLLSAGGAFERLFGDEVRVA